MLFGLVYIPHETKRWKLQSILAKLLIFLLHFHFFSLFEGSLINLTSSFHLVCTETSKNGEVIVVQERRKACMKAAILKLTWLLSSYQSVISCYAYAKIYPSCNSNRLERITYQSFSPRIRIRIRKEVKMDDGGRDDYLDPIFPGQREGCLHASRG